MPKMTVRDVWPMVKEAGEDWMDDKASKLAAALAYYTVISLAPLIVITIKIVGLIYRDEPSQKVEGQVEKLTGGVGGETIGDIVRNASQEGSGILATTVSIIIVIVAASAVFGELQDSLNTIWEVKPKPNRGIWGTIRDRFLSMAMVLGIAFLFLLSLAVSTAIGAISGGVMNTMVGPENVLTKVVAYAVDLVISTAVVTVLFAAIYKMLPDVKITWSDVWIGALLTGVLFQLGKYALTIYFAFSSTASAYGAAGSLIALLIWIYYSAQILFFGAEVTQNYSRKFGSGIQPAANALPVGEAERANLGMAPGARKEPPIQPPRVVRITPPARKELKRPLIFGSGGVAAGLLLGAVGAYAYKRTRPSKQDALAVELDHRLDAVEQRMLQIKGLYDTAHNLNRPAPEVVEVPVQAPPPVFNWRSALRNVVWRHPALWPVAKAVHLDQLKTR